MPCYIAASEHAAAPPIRFAADGGAELAGRETAHIAIYKLAKTV